MHSHPKIASAATVQGFASDTLFTTSAYFDWYSDILSPRKRIENVIIAAHHEFWDTLKSETPSNLSLELSSQYINFDWTIVVTSGSK